MNISFLRPQYLWLLPIVIIFIIYIIKKCKLIKKSANQFINKNSTKLCAYTPNQIYKRLLIKGFSRCLAYICFVLAIAGISWGSVSTAVQKNGKACTFVFDISYSMNATDAPNSLTRLQASAEYAKMLMNYMQGVSISCVLAKGDGIIAIPQTEDFASIHSLLEILSPTMMSAQGTSLGKGIECALKTFPKASAKSSLILLFTDGDETDASLQASLNKAIRSGVDVYIIGFGSEREVEVISGDGKTPVKTALREQKLIDICKEVNRKNQTGKEYSFIKTAHVNFVDASEVGSAVKVIYELKSIPQSKKYSSVDELLKNTSTIDESVTVSYELQKVDRHRLFIFLSLIFILIGVFASDFSIKNIKLSSGVTMLFLLPIFFTSCNTNFDEAKLIFESTWDWYKKDYNKAISGFTKAKNLAEEDGDILTKQYALYGLSVTYLLQNEKNASLEKLKEISPSAPPKIRFASYYNAGIIAQREGDYEKAQELFKQALLVLPDNVDAKINLELSLNQESQKAKDGQQQMLPASENQTTESDLEKSIFNRMRENDKKQWKNYDMPEKNNSVIDY